MIELISNLQVDFVDVDRINKALNKALKTTDRHVVNIHFPSDEEIINLNIEFRKKDYIPDVLSFDYRKEKMFDHEISGEVFISLKKAKTQAEEKNLPINYEVLYLLTHGVLHTLGYDHNTDEEEKTMVDLEKKIINEYIA